MNGKRIFAKITEKASAKCGPYANKPDGHTHTHTHMSGRYWMTV